MANNPKKIVDPTEAALSAIQEALKVRDDDDLPDSREVHASAPAHDDWHDAPEVSSQHAFEPEDTSPQISGPRAYPANDDQQSIGQILRALQNRPPRTSYLVASIFSGAWILGCGAAINFIAGDQVRAPDWMQRIGLEWAHRLVSEPGRLAERYLRHDAPYALGLLCRAAAGRRPS